MTIDRRRFLAATTALAGAAVAGRSEAGQEPPAPRTKGPRVWLDMDQRELDDAYTQSVYAPNQLQVTGRYATNSALTRQRLGEPRRFTYGVGAVEALDVFVAPRPNGPILVFLKGGAWRKALASSYAFPADVFVNAGINYVVPDFTDVDTTGGDLMPMADQVRRAVAWTWRNAKAFGGNPDRLYIGGFSSGGHLAAVALVTDWARAFNVPADILKGGICCSGIFDLKPVRLSVRSSYVRFTDAVEEALSPQRHLDKLVCPVTLASGTFETPEFQRQARDFAAAARAAGKQVDLVIAEGYNHFEMMETLGNPYGIVGRAALQRIGT